MAGLFDGATLRTQFASASYTQINAATGVSNAYDLLVLRKECRLVLISNNSSASINFWLVAPNMDPTQSANRQFAWSVGPNEALNLDVFGLTLDAGTNMFISVESGTAVTGEYVRVFAWG